MPTLSAASDVSSMPPSPADGSPRRMSWSKLVQRLTDFGAGVHSSSTSSNSSIMESTSSTGSRSDLSDSGWDVSGELCPSHDEDDDLFYDPTEESILQDVVSLIALSLRDAKDSDCALRCAKLLIPEELLERVGSEMLRLAASEPCGLRGASIHLCVERGDLLESVEQISVDPYLVPTFQLTLVLRLESGGLWPKIQELFHTAKPPGATTAPAAVKPVVRLGTGFRVIKKKLYSSEELLVEEC